MKRVLFVFALTFITCALNAQYLSFYEAMASGAILDKAILKKFQLVERQSTPYGEKY
jgi:hypothetical protein